MHLWPSVQTTLALADRLEKQRLLRELFGWVAIHEGGWERARDVQQALTEAGQHRSGGPG